MNTNFCAARWALAAILGGAAVGAQALTITGFSATFDCTQDLHAPRQTITARCTPAAGLAGEELFQITHQRDHADLVVDGHRQRRTQTAACFTNAFEFHRQIKMGLGQEVGPCPAR